MTERIDVAGLPNPSPHSGAGETYLHRMCLLLDQISRRLDDMGYPLIGVTSGPDTQVELVTEPADPAPPARKAAAGAAGPRKKNPPASKKDG